MIIDFNKRYLPAEIAVCECGIPFSVVNPYSIRCNACNAAIILSEPGRRTRSISGLYVYNRHIKFANIRKNGWTIHRDVEDIRFDIALNSFYSIKDIKVCVDRAVLRLRAKDIRNRPTLQQGEFIWTVWPNPVVVING